MTRVPLDTVKQAASALRGVPGVKAADVVPSDARLDRHALELVIGPGYVRVPPRVLLRLSEHDLGIRSVDRQGSDYLFVLAC